MILKPLISAAVANTGLKVGMAIGLTLGIAAAAAVATGRSMRAVRQDAPTPQPPADEAE